MIANLAARAGMSVLVVTLLLRRGHLVAAVVAGALLVLTLQLSVLAPRADRRIQAVMAATGAGASRVLSWTVTAVLAVLVVMPVAAARWFFGITPRDPGRSSAGGSWTVTAAATGRDAPDRAPYGASRVPSASRAVRVGRVALVLVAAGLATVLLWPGSRSTSSELLPPYDPALSAALIDQPDASATLDAIVQATAQSRIDAFRGYRPTDVHEEYLTIVDGERRTTSSEAPGAAEVWFTGGSALFGYGQRDAHTIPSAFARLAAERGIEVRVRNLGVPGYTSYQSALALEDALSRHAAPDLVVSYDGYNDAMIGLARPLIPAPPGDPAHLLLPDLVAGVDRDTGTDQPAVPPPPLDPEARLDGAMAAHQRGIDLARAVTEAHGSAYVATWQPTYFTRSPTDGEERSMRQLGIDAGLEAVWRDLSDGLRARLDEDVVDLADCLDDAPPVFYDQVHTSERGAEIVADALLDAVGERYAPLASAP